jgi:hypothetical protein
MPIPPKPESGTAVQRIWEAAEKTYGSNAERPLQIVVGNTAPAGERFFLIGVLPGRSVPSFLPMESRIPLVVREEGPGISAEACRNHLGRVTVIRGDIQEDEFADFTAFREALDIET